MQEPFLTGRRVVGPVSARINIDGREYINFFGSQYLALALVPEVRVAVLETLERGAPFAEPLPAALGTIDRDFEAVELAAAAACGTQASVYFASGYLIGRVALASMEPAPDLLFLDASAHYNLQDAAKVSDLPCFTFEHADADSLRDLLRRHVRPHKLPAILTDGVFATSGRLAPLEDYASALAPYDGRCIVDESHAFGVVGATGRGAAEYCGIEERATIGTTLSKAYCAQGAIVPCFSVAAKRLRTEPPVRGACAGSPLSAAAAAASLEYVARHPEIRERIRTTADYLRGRLRCRGIEVVDTPAPIVSFQYGTRAQMERVQHRLFDQGIYIYLSHYLGAGPEGVIRCAIFRDHVQADIDALIDALG
jgi:8-amino-7-oxononanoate synthase